MRDVAEAAAGAGLGESAPQCGLARLAQGGGGGGDGAYADEGILIGIDATGPVEEVTSRAMAAIRPFVR